MKEKSDLHSVIDAILRGDLAAVQKIVRDIPSEDPRHNHFSALLLFKRQTRSTVEDDVKASQTLSAAMAVPPDDQELLSALLFAALKFAISTNQRDEMRRVFSRLEGLSDQSPTLRCRLLTRLAEWSMAQLEGNHDRQFAALTAAIDLLRKNKGPIWAALMELRTVDVIMNDDFARAEQDIKELEPHHDTAFLKSSLYYFTGRIQEGLEVLKTVQDEKTVLLQGAVLMLKARRFSEANDCMDRLRALHLPVDCFESVLAIESLAKHDIGKARVHNQRAIVAAEAFRPEARRSHLYMLAWVELAAADAVLARTILTQIDPTGAASYLHAEWARLHLLEGDDVRAAAHFRMLLDKGIPELVEDKLRFAYEISAQRLSRLWMLAQKAGPIPSPKPTSPRTPSLTRTSDEARERVRLIGDSTAMRDLTAMITRIAPLETTVLITGETGTGKEVVARLLHELSPRAGNPFIAVNCGSLSEQLIESDLFGHKKGSFTGANEDRQGLFQAAGMGTIFLDEINVMSTRLQAALLRVIEYGEIRPLGSDRLVRNRARILAASNESLDARIKDHSFRSDLYFRLTKLHLMIPPLRERKEDIPVLCRHFLRELLGGAPFVLCHDFLEELKAHAWPGNVRELKNKLETMILFAGEHLTFDGRLFTRIRGQVASDKAEEPIAREIASVGRGASETMVRILDKRQHLRELFQKHQRLTQMEVVQRLGCAPNTAKKYLKELMGEGVIRRVSTSGNLCTSFFVHQDAERRLPMP